jgi:glutamate dehydrogenase/leucine dehydrogenase
VFSKSFIICYESLRHLPTPGKCSTLKSRIAAKLGSSIGNKYFVEKENMAALLPVSQTSEISDKQRGVNFDNHEFVMSLNDDKSGLRAYIAIHNTNLGPALGGTRMVAYASDEDALEDVFNLSKAMSYKCALANLPYGGGKAVILADDKLDRDQVLLAYARLVEKLRGLFKTGTDVGISDDDVKKMATQTSHMLGQTEADRGDLSTSSVAALGVFYAMKAALRQLYGSSDFIGKKVAVKGIGKLGGELARLVSEAGASVIVADVNEAKCQELQERLPQVAVMSTDEIHRQEVDIYAPCALGNELTDQSIKELHCKAIVGGANNQLANSQIGDRLNDRGVLYAPDYIANAGGLIYVADELEPDGFNKQRVTERTKAIEQTMFTIFEQARRQNAPPYQVADMLARARINGSMDG